MRPKAKYAVIYRHRNEYLVSVMCRFFQMSRSGYYDFVHRLGRPEKDATLAEIIAEQRERSFRTYGYRRMWLVLEKRGIHRNPKTILRIMEKYGLLAEIRRHRKWVNMGQQVHKYENLLNRQFHADRPNSKWVTDISYIHIKQGGTVPVHDPGSLRQQYRGLQDQHRANGKPGAGHHSPGYAQGEKEGRCGAPPPQRPWVPVHIPSIL